jgi:hypothetical protein
MPMTDFPTTIAAGASLSAPVFVTDAGKLVRISMPPDWTVADLTFQVSTDDVTFYDLFDQTGLEVKAGVTPGSSVVLETKFQNLGATMIKFRSGTRQKPVPQAAVRTLKISVLT